MLFLSFVSDHWRKCLFPLIAVVAVLVFLFIPRGQAQQETDFFDEQIPFEENEVEDVLTADEIEEIPALFVVDVQGAVLHPGVYTLEEDARLIDAIQAAGGYVVEADTRLVNHALKLSDELLIYIPVVGEAPVEENTVMQSPTSQSAESGGGAVNINTASESELTTLNGIGPAKAAAIIQHREEQGAFQSPEDLMKISGIGQKTFEKLQSEITVK